MCRFYKALYSLIPLKRIRYYLIKKHFFACSCCQEDWEEVEDRLKDMWSLQDWIKSEGNLWPDNYNFGKIWVDAEDSSILQIQWDQRSIKDFDENLASSIGDLKRNVTWTVEYGLEIKGVRFPSEQTIEETYIIHTGSKYQKYLASIFYDRYKFFTVETQVKY